MLETITVISFVVAVIYLATSIAYIVWKTRKNTDTLEEIITLTTINIAIIVYLQILLFLNRTLG